ncbi:MAG: hypothetical protein IJ790_00905 [Lachnospiraceae bacterium]|nr:hypothetical protein [Lachnospiraceae bacterium]
MKTVENLLHLDVSELTPKKKTHEIKIDRISRLLHKKGIEEDFNITIETIDADTLYDYESEIYEVENGKLKVNKKAMYKKGLEICNIAIIDPKYNDPQLLNFLGITMKQPIPEVVWTKLLTKNEILSVSQRIIELSRNNLAGEDDYDAKLEKERNKIKN